MLPGWQLDEIIRTELTIRVCCPPRLLIDAEPEAPVEPVDPVAPVEPDWDPVEPVEPVEPVAPVDPVEPELVEPVDPVDPVAPVEPMLLLAPDRRPRTSTWWPTWSSSCTLLLEAIRRYSRPDPALLAMEPEDPVAPVDPAWLPVCPAPVWLPVLPLPPVLELPVVPAELPAPAALPLPDVLPLALPELLPLPIFAFLSTNSPPAPALPLAPVDPEVELARARQPVTVISRCDCEPLRSSSSRDDCDWLLLVEPVWPACPDCPAWPDPPDDCADTTPQVVARAKLPATISLCQWKVFFIPDLLV